MSAITTKVVISSLSYRMPYEPKRVSPHYRYYRIPSRQALRAIHAPILQRDKNIVAFSGLTIVSKLILLSSFLLVIKCANSMAKIGFRLIVEGAWSLCNHASFWEV